MASAAPAIADYWASRSPITAVVMVVQIAHRGRCFASLALLADAAHMFTDAAALVIALIASAVAARPANDRRTFDSQRAEVFGALANGIILIALAVWGGVRRDPAAASIRASVEVAGGLMLVVAITVGLAANAVAMWLLQRGPASPASTCAAPISR